MRRRQISTSTPRRIASLETSLRWRTSRTIYIPNFHSRFVSRRSSHRWQRRTKRNRSNTNLPPSLFHSLLPRRCPREDLSSGGSANVSATPYRLVLSPRVPCLQIFWRTSTCLPLRLRNRVWLPCISTPRIPYFLLSSSRCHYSSRSCCYACYCCFYCYQHYYLLYYHHPHLNSRCCCCSPRTTSRQKSS